MVLSDVTVLEFFSTVISSSITWWVISLLALLLIERYDLGLHSLPWHHHYHYSNRKLIWNRAVGSSSLDTIDGDVETDGYGKSSNCLVPMEFYSFISNFVIPNFSLQCQSKGQNYAVLSLTRIDSLHKISALSFEHITFNGKPLVDPKKCVYPEAYRYVNYVVARTTTTTSSSNSKDDQHPLALIAKQVPSLLRAYRASERSYMRDPVPRFGVLYCHTVPCCSVCTHLITKALAGMCSRKIVLAYSELKGSGGVEESINCFLKAGFLLAEVVGTPQKDQQSTTSS